MAAWFRSLDPVQPKDMVGLWSGVGIPSDHPLDGVLENLNWFGKRFHSDMRADALLFTWRPGRLVALEPIPRVTARTLILQCRDDIIASEEVGEFVHQQVPNSQLVVLNASGHCPNLSAPDEVISAIRRFV
ncbi:alpha/beta fold hydrolase [Rhizobium leguminosarum]|uniref:alpha/beta fold hydrolase n=1 Tax=Rhizobium leguminosarum TaxID=384 RepID=UPI0035E3FE57